MTYRDVVAALRMKLAIEYLRNTRVTHSRTCDTTSLPLSQVTRGRALNDWSISTLGRSIGSPQLKVKLSIGQLHCL